MRKFIWLLVISFLASVLIPQKSFAESEADCAIWLCLPGGFPDGCSAAYNAFKSRIKKGRSPLPDLASCSTGPNGEKSNGKYEMGYEYFEPCREDYVLKEQRDGYFTQGRCVLKACERFRNHYCQSYDAVRRPKPSYIKMWVDGSYLGQFFY